MPAKKTTTQSLSSSTRALGVRPSRGDIWLPPKHKQAQTPAPPTLWGRRRRVSGAVSATAPTCRSGGENLVEDRLCLVLVGVLSEGQLAHQDLACLGKHPLLAGRQTAVLVAAPQVTEDLGDLDHV